jgi:hypothetical protein
MAFTRGDVGEEEDVASSKASRKSLKRSRAREAVRLKGDQEAPIEPFPRRPERHPDLLGVVPVVVDDGHAAHRATHLEAAVDAAEGRHRLHERRERDAHLGRNGDRGEDVLGDVASGHPDLDRAVGARRSG